MTICRVNLNVPPKRTIFAKGYAVVAAEKAIAVAIKLIAQADSCPSVATQRRTLSYNSRTFNSQFSARSYQDDTIEVLYSWTTPPNTTQNLFGFEILICPL